MSIPSLYTVFAVVLYCQNVNSTLSPRLAAVSPNNTRVFVSNAGSYTVGPPTNRRWHCVPPFIMGLCVSTKKEVRWEERWSSPSYKKALKEFCARNDSSSGTNGGLAIVTGTLANPIASTPKAPATDDRGKVLRGVSRDGEFRNWAASVQTAPAKVLRPQSIKDVQDHLMLAREQRPFPKIRCMGSGHSWTHLFADDGAWMFDTSGLKHLLWTPENPLQVTIGPGVTPAQLATFLDSKERGEWRGLFLSSDVVLETVTYGGAINSGCHGTGKAQTLPDYVLSTSIIKWDGTRVDLDRADDPEGFALKVLHFGLLGITVSLTLQLDGDTNAIRVTDSKMQARELFLEKDQLPQPGGYNPLLEAWNNGYAIEVFYFPASSLEIRNIFSKEFEDQSWNPYNDICAVKAFDRTSNPVKKDDDSFLGWDSKTSTRFDRNFSISNFVSVNVGSELGQPLVAKIGGNPALVSLYSNAAARAFEPFGKTSGQVSYETSLAQAIHWQKYITDSFPVSDTEVCIKCDPDFTSAYKAIHQGIEITKRFAEEEGSLALNVAMELRFTKHSDSPLSPAYGHDGDVFMWIEVLSSTTTPLLREFNTKIVDAWLAIKLKVKDGSQAARPHWAKWGDAYVVGAEAKMKRAYADRLPALRRVAKEFDPHGVFVNKFFAKLLAP